jgi:hypothetical protein
MNVCDAVEARGVMDLAMEAFGGEGRIYIKVHRL